ncbi:hypothetical protein TD95_002943 [Thielaviopsis punctulata]|uniref:Peptidase S8/S53 domain-containing protein n=1 Tax=Thielaviopsis punctulata TaxID=72032 RepID=A0A0F4ZKC4_9PEZI|nr:hypothetical protein TD95_002943 [Thielaviopsis punctulata]
MKILTLFSLVALCSCTQLNPQPSYATAQHTNGPGNKHVIPDQYIVSLQSGITSLGLQAHVKAVSQFHARSVSRRNTVGVVRTMDYEGVFHGYVGSFDADTVEWLARHPDVAEIEQDTIVALHRANSSAIVTQHKAAWGIAALSHNDTLSLRPSNMNGYTYTYDARAGAGQVAYVLDTGVDTSNPDFEGRAAFGYNALPHVSAADREGHGTHVAGTIISRTWGVAKKGRVVSVKIMDTDTDSMSTVLDGFNWAVHNITHTPSRLATSTINMSLGGFRSRTLNRLVSAAFAMGIPTVASAGNNAMDVYFVSPAGCPDAISVGAMDVRGRMWVWSNYGPLLDVLAPGVEIYSLATPGSMLGDRRANVPFVALSGTSMAAPHITGLALYLRSTDPKLDTAAKLKKRIIEISRKGTLTLMAENTPNRMAYNGLALELENPTAVNETGAVYHHRVPPVHEMSHLVG